MQNNFPHHALNMAQYPGSSLTPPHPDLIAAFAERGRPPQPPFNGAAHQAHSHYGALGMGVPGGVGRSDISSPYAHSSRLPGDMEGGPAKRPRPAGSTVPEDALMELARENLVLKHQLHLATMEAQRLTHIIEGYSQNKPNQRQQPSLGSQTRYWSDEEHQKFLEGVNKFGAKDVRAIAFVVGTRTPTQVRSHAQKFFMKLASQNKSSDLGGEGSQLERGNPDREPGMRGVVQSAEVAAATVAASGDGGTSAAAAAAFVAAHSKISNTDAHREGARNGMKRAAENNGQGHSARGRGGGSGTPDSSESMSTAERSSAATAQHENGSGSGTSSAGSGGVTGDSASNNASNDGESASNNGSNSHEGSEQGFFGSMEAADDDLSGEDYAYSFPMAQGFAVPRGQEFPASSGKSGINAPGRGELPPGGITAGGKRKNGERDASAR